MGPMQSVWVRRWKGAGWLGAVIGCAVALAVGGAGEAQAYSVFPAKGASERASTAQPTGREARVTLNVADSTIAYAINDVTRQAGLRPVFNGNPLFLRRISVHVVNVPVMDALAVILKGTGLVAKLASDEETVMIRSQADVAAGQRAKMQGGIITGRVTDSTSGAGLKGAQVRVDGMARLSSVTSDSGRFMLQNVPPGDQVLQVRLFGYRPVTRPVTVVDGERTTVRIAMAAVPTVLSGVVTTATGTQRKVEVGNDITTINVDSVMQVAPITSVTDLLETRVPGLTVLHSSGVPGAPSRLRLRGASSIIGNNDPILVVDGVRVYASQSDSRNNLLATSFYGSNGVNVPGVQNIQVSPAYVAPSPLDQIDPNDIATIEVFKGPSASALYGSDAANGVIIITTKHGRAGPTHWSLSLGQGMNWTPGTWPMNYYRFGVDSLPAPNSGGVLSNGMCVFGDIRCTPDSIVAFQALNDPRYTVFSHGSDQTAALTVSGGVPTLQYSLTGSAAGNVGNLKLPAIEVQRYKKSYGPIPHWMVRPDNYQTWGVNGSLVASPYSTLRVTLQSSLFNSDQQQGSLQQAISQLEGEYINATAILSLSGRSHSLIDSSLIQNDVERATAASLATTHALTLNWQPVQWLPLTATAGLNTIQRTDLTYIPYGIPQAGVGTALGIDDTTGSYGLGRGTSQDKTLTVGSSIPVLGNRLTVGVGGNLHSASTADFNVHTDQLAPGVTTPTSFMCADPRGLIPCPSNQTSTAGSTYGWYVEPRLNISSRFFAAPGFRLDGGSASGTHGGFSGTGLTGFPKIDFSWLAVDQSHPHGILTLLRPRLAFGYAGTQPGPTEKLRLLNSGGGSVVSLNDTTILPAVFVTTLGNTQLRPEQSSELEGGFDAELWHGRFSLTYTQYDKTRHNAIIPVPVAPSVVPSTGIGNVQSYYLNIGEVRNTGRELSMNAQLFESRTLGWTVGGNLSNVNNVVVHLNNGLSQIDLGSNEFIKPGYPLFSQWAYPIVSFSDANHDGIVEPNEIRYGDSLAYAGQADPKYQLNLNTGVTLLQGRLSVNATFAYQDGMTQFNYGALQSGAFSSLLNASNTPLATQAAIVAASCTQVIQSQLGFVCSKSSPIGLIQTVNTFRFNSLSVNFSVPTALARWFRVPRMALALQGQNLGLHTNYRGKDPNVNAFSTVSAGDETVDLGQIPESRTWWLKLSMGN